MTPRPIRVGERCQEIRKEIGREIWERILGGTSEGDKFPAAGRRPADQNVLDVLFGCTYPLLLHERHVSIRCSHLCTG